MPKRAQLLNLLLSYRPSSNEEKETKNEIMSFVRQNPCCFLRSNLIGHITGSCFVLNPEADHILLTHHKKIGRWLQLGGHADGDHDILRVSLREAKEESGIENIVALSENIFDIDIHEIMEHKGVPKHKHYDIRFVFQAQNIDFKVSNESLALRWVPLEEVASLDINNRSLIRMVQKWQEKKYELKSHHLAYAG